VLPLSGEQGPVSAGTGGRGGRGQKGREASRDPRVAPLEHLNIA
jgi:hypothetical protein